MSPWDWIMEMGPDDRLALMIWLVVAIMVAIIIGLGWIGWRLWPLVQRWFQ